MTIKSRLRDKFDKIKQVAVKIIYEDHARIIKAILLKRKRLTIKLGRKIKIEEIEQAVEDFLNENAF